MKKYHYTRNISLKRKEQNSMNPLDIIKNSAAYANGYENTPTAAQAHAKQLCWEYNQTAPNEQDKRNAILQALFGTCSPMTGIDVNVNYIFKKKRNLMFRKNGIIFFRIFDESLEACDSQFAIL